MRYTKLVPKGTFETWSWLPLPGPVRSAINDFVRAHNADAPSAYPEVHHVTRPLRTAAAAAGDAHRLHLWAGAGWQRLRPMPAADLVRTIAAEL